MTKLTLDEATHIYRVDGRIVPSVTQIMGEAGLSDFSAVPADVLEAACQFGRAVHHACELDDQGRLDEPALDPDLLPYLEAWRAFKSEHIDYLYLIEEKMHSPKYDYAGTPDRMARLCRDSVLSKIHGLRQVTNVEIKSTTSLAPSTAIQTAAYVELAKAQARICVLLKPDGTYTPEVYTDRSDFRVFLSALQIWRWKAKNNLLKKGENDGKD